MPGSFQPANAQLLGRLVSICPIAVVTVDPENRISFCNPAFERLFYHRSEDVLGKDLSTLLGIAGIGAMASAIHFLSRAEIVTLTLRARRKDETALDVDFYAVPDMSNGTYGGYCGVFLDVTERHRTEHALSVSDTKFSRAFDASPVTVALSTAQENRLIDVNDTWVRLTGYSRDEAIGRTPVELGIVSADQFQRIGAQLAAQHGSVRNVECRLRMRDGRLVIGSVSADEFEVHGRSLRIVAMVDVTALRHAEDTLSRVSQALIDTQEKERLRISNALHDDVGQRLAAWQMAIDRLARDHRPSMHDVADGLAELRKQASDIATAVRDLSREMHSPSLSLLSVDKVLSELCTDTAKRLEMRVDFSSRRVPRLVGTETAVCLFRVLQEGLTNATRHSGTRRMRVTLWGTPGAVHLRIRDFGHGFSVEAAMNGAGTGLGLITMRERVALVNGTLSINSKPQRGTCIDVTVPVVAPDEATRRLP